MFRKIVKGAAKENNMLFLLGPIFCNAKNNRVSPKKTPIIPEIIIVIKKFILIDDHVFETDAQKINIIDTNINLILLKPIPPNVRVRSAEINEAIDQERAANKARI